MFLLKCLRLIILPINHLLILTCYLVLVLVQLLNCVLLTIILRSFLFEFFINIRFFLLFSVSLSIFSVNLRSLLMCLHGLILFRIFTNNWMWDVLTFWDCFDVIWNLEVIMIAFMNTVDQKREQWHSQCYNCG